MKAVKSFFLKLLIVVGLFVASIIVFAINQQAGLYLGLALLLVPGIAVFRPIPGLGLSSRGFSFSIVFFVGLITTIGSWGTIQNDLKVELQALRAREPDAYLERIKDDEAFWLSEMKALAPERYEIELARLEAEREAAAREKAEKEAAERAEAERRRTERAAAREKEQAQKTAAYIEKIKREIDSLPEFDAREYIDSQTSLTIALALFSAWVTMYEEGANLPLSDEEKAIRNKLKTLVKQTQRKSFPILRDAYGPIMRKVLWEHDTSARTFGNGFSTVEFVSGIFAANRFIKEFQENASDTLHMLRFKRAQYRWFKGASEYTYYDVKSLPDDALVIWKDNGRYREVD